MNVPVAIVGAYPPPDNETLSCQNIISLATNPFPGLPGDLRLPDVGLPRMSQTSRPRWTSARVLTLEILLRLWDFRMARTAAHLFFVENFPGYDIVFRCFN